MKRLIVLFLVFSLALSALGVAFAESEEVSDRLADLQVKMNGRIYTFCDSIDGMKNQGVDLGAQVKADRWYRVGDEEHFFELLTGKTADPEEGLCVCGIRIQDTNWTDAEIAKNIILGKTTTKELFEKLGEPFDENLPDIDGGFSFRYLPEHQYVKAEFGFRLKKEMSYDDMETAIEEFDSWEEFLADARFGGAVLSSIEVTTKIPGRFGLEKELTALAESNAVLNPDELGFDEFLLNGVLYKGHITIRDLVENGWKIDDHDTDKEFEATVGGGHINSWNVWMYDGNGLICVFPYNRATEGTCKLQDCDVMAIQVSDEDNVSLIIKGGLTPGVAYNEVLSVFDVEYKENQKKYRAEELRDYIRYEFQMDDADYLFHVKDNTVIEIRVEPVSPFH